MSYSILHYSYREGEALSEFILHYSEIKTSLDRNGLSLRIIGNPLFTESIKNFVAQRMRDTIDLMHGEDAGYYDALEFLMFGYFLNYRSYHNLTREKHFGRFFRRLWEVLNADKVIRMFKYHPLPYHPYYCAPQA